MSSQPGQRRLRGAVMGFACLISLPGAALQPRQGPREAVLLECASDGAGRCREVTATLPPDARKRGLNAVWGDGKGTIYIAGNAGTLLAWDGSKWTSVDSGVRDGSDLTALWGTASGQTRVWAGTSRGGVLRSGPTSAAPWQVSATLTSASHQPVPIAGGWSSAVAPIMWVIAGSAAHLLPLSGTGQVTGDRALESPAPREDNDGMMQVALTGVQGVDDPGGGWDLAIADDSGRLSLFDQGFPDTAFASAHPVLPTNLDDPRDSNTTAAVPVFEGLWSLLQPGGGELLVGAGTFGRLFTQPLAPAGAVQSICKGHGCYRGPFYGWLMQLGFRTINTIVGPDSAHFWAAGDGGLVAHTNDGGSHWSPVASDVQGEAAVDLRGGWLGSRSGSANAETWFVGERLCPGRLPRGPIHDANLVDFWRDTDPDFTNAFQCAELALCPDVTAQPCGGTINVPAGVFPISDTVDLATGVGIAGVGSASVIEWRGSGLNPLGGDKVALDLHGQHRSACTSGVGPCVPGFKIPIDPLSSPNARSGRATELRDVVVRAARPDGSDSCAGDDVGRGRAVPDAVGIDIHHGYQRFGAGAEPMSLRNVTVCGFKSGIRISTNSQNGYLQGISARNNEIGFDLLGIEQWVFDDLSARGNGVGIKTAAEGLFHRLRLEDNVSGGMLIAEGAPGIDGLVAHGNVHPSKTGAVQGFDVAIINTRFDPHRAFQPVPNSVRGADVYSGLAAGFALSNASLGDGAGSPGRILVVNPSNAHRARRECRVSTIILQNVARTPLLDVLDECAINWQITNSPVRLRQLEDPTELGGDHPNATFLPLRVSEVAGLALVPAFESPFLGSWRVRNDNALVLRDQGHLSLGSGVLTPDVRSTDSDGRLVVPAWGGYPASTDVYAVGDHGAVAHWDGTRWSDLSALVAAQTGHHPGDLKGVWGYVDQDLKSSDLWIVGAGGTILRRHNGGSFERVPVSDPGAAQANLNGIWGYDANHAWAVGDGGVILQWDGHSWTRAPVVAPHAESLRAVMGFIGGEQGNDCQIDVWAVGDHGAVLRGRHIPGEGPGRCGEASLRVDAFAAPPAANGAAPLVLPTDLNLTDVSTSEAIGVAMAVASDGRRLRLVPKDRGEAAEISRPASGLDPRLSGPVSGRAALWGITTGMSFLMGATPAGAVFVWGPGGPDWLPDAPALKNPTLWGGGPADVWYLGTGDDGRPAAAHWNGAGFEQALLPPGLGSIRRVAGAATNLSRPAMISHPAALDLVSAAPAGGAASVTDLRFILPKGTGLAWPFTDFVAATIAARTAPGTGTALSFSFVHPSRSGADAQRRETMRLTSSGRVGIGTATPVDTLDVNGDLLTTGAVTGQGRTLLQTTDGPARCSPASRGALLLSAGPGGVGVPGVCGADGRVHPLQAP